MMNNIYFCNMNKKTARFTIGYYNTNNIELSNY